MPRAVCPSTEGARARVRQLRKDAHTQLAVVKEKQREVVRILKNVSAAAEGSWQKVKQSADAILADAGGTAASMVEPEGLSRGERIRVSAGHAARARIH